MDEHECERCALVVIIIHGVVGRHMQQVRVGHLIHQMDVQQQMEQRQYMCNIEMHYEMEQKMQMIA